MSGGPSAQSLLLGVVGEASVNEPSWRPLSIQRANPLSLHWARAWHSKQRRGMLHGPSAACPLTAAPKAEPSAPRPSNPGMGGTATPPHPVGRQANRSSRPAGESPACGRARLQRGCRLMSSPSSRRVPTPQCLAKSPPPRRRQCQAGRTRSAFLLLSHPRLRRRRSQQ